MKEYFILRIYKYAGDTQDSLNELAKDGWKLICSYANNNEYLILERDASLEKGDGQ